MPNLNLTAATANATVSTNIIITIGMTTQSNMSFGDVSSSTSLGSVVLGADSAVNSTGGVTVNTASTSTAASFEISGIPNANYVVSLPTSVVLSNTSGDTMVVDSFTSSEATGLLDASGTQSVNIGSTLNVSASQAIGSYSGSMSVTVAYN